MDFRKLIDQAAQKARAGRIEKPVPTIAQMTAAIERLATAGYEPTDMLLPIIGDYLSGYGVLVSGYAGRGKTFFFRAMGARIVEAADIIDWGMARIWMFHEQWDGVALCIDDIGAEHESSEWGVKDDLMKAIIAHRAEHQSGVTHITTNLTAAEVRARYGDRTLSRMMGMCRCHKMTGPDRRRPMAAIERKDG